MKDLDEADLVEVEDAEIVSDDDDQVESDDAEAVEVEADEAEAEAPEADDDTDDSAADDGGLVLTFDDGEGPENDPDESVVFRDLRTKYRKIKAENEKLKSAMQGEAKELRPKPTMKDHGYKDAEYEADLEAWYEEKREAEAAEEGKRKQAEAVQERYVKRLENYRVGAANLKVKDFDEVENTVRGELSEVQQSVIISVLKDPATVVYALGKNGQKLGDVAEIQDPIQFAAEVARLEAKMTVKGRKAAPPPEKRLKGSGPAPNSGDKTLEKLEAEAAKTGDRTKVIDHKRAMKKARQKG